MSFLQTFRIQDPESSGFRILKSSKMFYLQIFRIQDPESSGSKDPAGKSQEGRQIHKYPNTNAQIHKCKFTKTQIQHITK